MVFIVFVFFADNHKIFIVRSSHKLVVVGVAVDEAGLGFVGGGEDVAPVAVPAAPDAGKVEQRLRQVVGQQGTVGGIPDLLHEVGGKKPLFVLFLSVCYKYWNKCQSLFD